MKTAWYSLRVVCYMTLSLVLIMVYKFHGFESNELENIQKEMVVA